MLATRTPRPARRAVRTALGSGLDPRLEEHFHPLERRPFDDRPGVHMHGPNPSFRGTCCVRTEGAAPGATRAAPSISANAAGTGATPRG